MITDMNKLRLFKAVDRILSTKGNMVKEGGQLEMAFVIDECADRAFLVEMASDIAKALKVHDKVFENVRCNVVFWDKTGKCETKLMPMSFVGIGRIFAQDNNEKTEEASESDNAFEKTGDISMDGTKRKLEELAMYLKKFQARSKCIILVSEENYIIADEKVLLENMSPFLKGKMLLVNKSEVKAGMMIWK